MRKNVTEAPKSCDKLKTSEKKTKTLMKTISAKTNIMALERLIKIEINKNKNANTKLK
jgi:hypothetical protein